MENPHNLKEAEALLKEIEKEGGVRPYARRIKRPATTVQQWSEKARKIVRGDLRPNKQKLRRDHKLRTLVDLMGGRCQLCKKSYPPQAYDFHHKDPAAKDFSIASMLDNDFEKVRAEAMKCALLCSNCHRVAHYVHKNLFINGESKNEK